ncbi:MAG TPA: cysteine desulfurase family protein [Vicinamibacterales bacterium]
MSPLYFDAHATTPCDPRVVTAMLPYFTETFGNAASRQHVFGWAAREAVDTARGEIASLIGARPKDIVFTSGATESNNLALKGGAEALAARGRHLVTVRTEHSSVLDVCSWLQEQGCDVTFLDVDRDGLVDPDRLRAALRDETTIVSVMAANNEIGVLQPLEAIGRITRERGILFHVDAVQAAGKVPFDVERVGADLVSLSAHKMYGPKGVGALYVRRRGPAADLRPLLHGGGHERGLRSGTLNVPAIVGFGVAARLCRLEMTQEAETLRALRDRLLARLESHPGGVRVNGSTTARLPHNLNVTFQGIDGSRLLLGLTDVAVSSGAACSSASAAPSHVLMALGLSEAEAKASLRFGLIRGTTAEQVDQAAARVAEVVTGLRAAKV